MSRLDRVRIGCGAGFADDRIEPAVELAERGRLNYLVFECLAERTVALAQRAKLNDPDAGYNEWLADRMEAVLEPCARQGVKIITNMGAANPRAAARAVAEIARRKGLTGLKIAAVTGDDVLDHVRGTDLPLLERPVTLSALGDTVISANAYTGIDGILAALRQDADIVIGGRIADPALFLAPLVHEFGWSTADWRLMGTGTAVGHLLECAAHVTGGYFADPGVKEVPDLARLGFPLAEVDADGSFSITKVEGSGGRVTVATVTEQLLYEVHDPAAYFTPDVVADFSGARLEQVGDDRVAVRGISGHSRPGTLKVSVGYVDSFIGEGEISYAGPNSVARGRLALDIVRQRLPLIGVPTTETRFDLIGVDAVHRGAGVSATGDPGEVRIRVVARTDSMAQARRVGHEVVALWLNGPCGGGGATRNAYEDIAVVSVFLDRNLISPTVILEES
ncbi:acyclic terpene utilization AtuA family protein [Nocardia sp. NPDC127526]|uniref:acyclic terpene utilization AtuA family protein n=1 Tax=Nocardia sp. NPDC127526 TaxID=3345393 RepID=UPI003636AE96